MKVDVSLLLPNVNIPSDLRSTNEDILIFNKGLVSLRWTLYTSEWLCSQNIDENYSGLVQSSGRDLIEELNIPVTIESRNHGLIVKHNGNLFELMHQVLPKLDNAELRREYFCTLPAPTLENIANTINRFEINSKEFSYDVIIENQDKDSNFGCVVGDICSYINIRLFSDYPNDVNCHYDKNQPLLYINISGNSIIMHGKTESPECIALLKDFCSELGNIVTGNRDEDLNTVLSTGDFYVFTDFDVPCKPLDSCFIQEYTLKFREFYPNFHIEDDIDIYTNVSFG